MMGTPSRLSWLTSPNSSSEAPLFESRIATSSRSTMPRSPCSESTGWRNEAGVPVDVRVAASLRAISPDLPTPDTMSRPCAAASSRTAAANGGPNRPATRSIAAASRARTRRPRSTRSLGSVRDIATLHEVLGQEALPLAPRLEDQFRDLTRRSLAPGGCGDDARRRLDLGHGIRHGDRQPHACEQRQVRQVVPHEGTLLPREPAPLEQPLERGQLARGGVLNDLVYRQLARPQRCGGRLAAAHPHHREAGGSQQPDPQAVLDVKPFEFDGVVRYDAQVHAVVGEHAVDVEADELQAAGERGVDHRCMDRAQGTRLRRRASTSLGQWTPLRHRPYNRLPAPPWAAPAQCPLSERVRRPVAAGRRGCPRAAAGGGLYGTAP